MCGQRAFYVETRQVTDPSSAMLALTMPLAHTIALHVLIMTVHAMQVAARYGGLWVHARPSAQAPCLMPMSTQFQRNCKFYFLELLHYLLLNVCSVCQHLDKCMQRFASPAMLARGYRQLKRQQTALLSTLAQRSAEFKFDWRTPYPRSVPSFSSDTRIGEII